MILCVITFRFCIISLIYQNDFPLNRFRINFSIVRHCYHVCINHKCLRSKLLFRVFTVMFIQYRSSYYLSYYHVGYFLLLGYINVTIRENSHRLNLLLGGNLVLGSKNTVSLCWSSQTIFTIKYNVLILWKYNIQIDEVLMQYD